jgi:hypothetical protein
MAGLSRISTTKRTTEQDEMNIVITTENLSYVVVCSDAKQMYSVLLECEEDGHKHRVATIADSFLEKVEYLDWNPA